MNLLKIKIKILSMLFLKVKPRIKSTDLEVFEYVFLKKYHRPTWKLRKEPVILDLGSNVGYSIIDLNRVYPKAKIYGVEMDRNNFEIAKKNLEHIKNAKIVNAAIWITNGVVTYDGNSNCDSFRIEETVHSELISIQSITIDYFLELNKLSIIDYVKMDIEGAEKILFNENCDWLKKVRSIKVEYHDELTYSLIKEKLSVYQFEVWKDSEHWSTICAVR
jgi:FkbM family methyltransferase